MYRPNNKLSNDEIREIKDIKKMQNEIKGYKLKEIYYYELDEVLQ